MRKRERERERERERKGNLIITKIVQGESKNNKNRAMSKTIYHNSE